MISGDSFRDVAFGILISHSQGNMTDEHALVALGGLLAIGTVDERIDIVEDIRERMPEAAAHIEKACIVKVTHDGHPVAVTVALSTKPGCGIPVPSEIPGLDAVLAEIGHKYGVDLSGQSGMTSGWIGGRGNPGMVIENIARRSHDNIVSDFAKQLDNLFPSPPAADWPAPTVLEGGDEDEPEQR